MIYLINHMYVFEVLNISIGSPLEFYINGPE